LIEHLNDHKVAEAVKEEEAVVVGEVAVEEDQEAHQQCHHSCQMLWF
jgi:hypothetical protein